MIRVLHVVGNMDFGGVETLLMNLYRHIDRNFVQFDFLAHNDIEGKYDPEILDLGGKILRIPSIRHSSYGRYVRGLRERFSARSSHPIVHSHMSDMNGVILTQAHRGGVAARISHSHIHNPVYRFPNSILKRYSRSLIGGAATHGLACSVEAARYLHTGRLLGETRVLNNAIDTADFSPHTPRREAMRSSLGLLDNYVLGHVGRFESQKNHALLLEVFERVYRQDARARLVLVGVGSLEGAVRADVERRGLTGVVRFLGPRSDVRDLMDAMDVFVFPSLYEGLGIVAVEAQSMGLPVLASEAVPRETQLTDQITYLPLGNATPWVDAVMELRNGDAARTREGYSAKVAAGGYDIRHVARELQEFYLDLDANQKQGRAGR